MNNIADDSSSDENNEDDDAVHFPEEENTDFTENSTASRHWMYDGVWEPLQNKQQANKFKIINKKNNTKFSNIHSSSTLIDYICHC